MKNIDVVVLNQAHDNPGGMMRFLAAVTQNGHKVHSGEELLAMYNKFTSNHNSNMNQKLSALPHGTIKRFAPITIAIVGASRRFLAQARTNQVGIDYLSASLQYSDYSDEAGFVVPYEITKAEFDAGVEDRMPYTRAFLAKCKDDAIYYKSMIERGFSNDTAGYSMNQAMRNILIMQGNHQAWDYFIRLRSCNRNTEETQYVTLKIWQALLSTEDGNDLFGMCGADCMHGGKCREGSMCCCDPIVGTTPQDVLLDRFPYLTKDIRKVVSNEKIQYIF
jgi:thymidylate synthase (FAD)